MASVGTGGVRSKNLVLAAMIFAVAMTFIDQTIVSIAVPEIQKQLGLSATGVQWAVNAYLLAMASFFAFGGRLADTVGHRRMVVIGVIVFAGASTLCGLTPKGSVAEAWIVTFRAIQGVGGAIMFPAALAIVVQTFPLRERGKALATFFGIAGGLTAVGPILGGYLDPVDVAGHLLGQHPGCRDRPGADRSLTSHHRVPAGPHGLPRSGAHRLLGWGSRWWASSSHPFGDGAIPPPVCASPPGWSLLVVFGLVELRTASPLMDIRIFRIRAFLVENLVLFVSMLAFVPVFFFASEYAQISLGKTASEAGLFLLYFFIGFVIAAQIGGRMLDRGGAKRPVVLGCVLAAVGFWLWAGKVTGLSFDKQQWYIILAGAGVGFMLGPASTDAVNRASRLSYGEATGITQTVRNYAASLGLAILGTIQVTVLRSRLATALWPRGCRRPRPRRRRPRRPSCQGGSGPSSSIPHFFRLDFAYATRSVLYGMAAVMAVGAVIGFVGLRQGLQADPEATGAGAPAGRRRGSGCPTIPPAVPGH